MREKKDYESGFAKLFNAHFLSMRC